MGNSKDTQSALQELDSARLEALCESANSLLTKPLPLLKQPNEAELMKILRAVVEEKFKQKYTYAYQGDQSNPPAVAWDATSNIIPADNICCIQSLDSISRYINTTILSSIHPTWVKDAARQDLVDIGTNIFHQPPKDSWSILYYTKQYDTTQYDSAQYEANSFKFDAVLVNCTISLSKGPCAIIYYAGVCYQVLSPKIVAERDLFSTLVSKSNELLDKPIPISSPPSIDDIKKILRIYGQKLFKTQFQFPYNDDRTLPKDMSPGAILHSTDALCFIKDKDPDILESFIQSDILSVMYIPYWAKDAASSALLSEAQGLLNVTTANNWTHAPFTNTYGNLSLADNSYKTAAIFVYTNASATVGNDTVYMTFIYYMGVYYGTSSPLALTTGVFLEKLYKGASDLDSLHPSIGLYHSIQDIDALLKAYGRKTFLENFGFQYLGDQTKPGDMCPGTQAQGIEVLLYIKDNSADKLNDRVELEILQQIAFPRVVQERAATDFLNFMASTLTQPTNFVWNHQKSIHSYEIDDDDVFAANGILIYSNSTLTEGAVEVTATLIHYVGVYYVGSSPWVKNGK
jgi:hypothetical protein